MNEIHEPHCNTSCRLGFHYLASGVGLPHIHMTNLGLQCGKCAAPPVEGVQS